MRPESTYILVPRSSQVGVPAGVSEPLTSGEFQVIFDKAGVLLLKRQNARRLT